MAARLRSRLALLLRVLDEVSSSYDAVSANDGQAAITRPSRVGSATATLAARLATAPSNQQRPRQHPTVTARPRIREQCSGRGDDHPIDRQRCERRDLSRLAMPRHEHVHVWVRDRASDQREQRHASDRGPADPPVRARVHRVSPRTSSPVMGGVCVRKCPRGGLNPEPREFPRIGENHSATVTG